MGVVGAPPHCSGIPREECRVRARCPSPSSEATLQARRGWDSDLPFDREF